MFGRNGKRARRALAMIGSAGFVGGLALTAAPADAGIYLSLKPIDVNGAAPVVSGNAYTGYTLTLSSATAVVNYGIDVQITDGATTNAVAANPALKFVSGAVRTSASSGVTGAHNTYAFSPTGNFTGNVSGITTGAVFQLNTTSTPQASFPNTYLSYRPGVAAPLANTINGGSAPALGGVGPQFANFNNLSGVSVDLSGTTRFEVNYSSVNTDPASSSLALPNMGAAFSSIATASVTLTNTDPSTGTASISFVGGNGANGTDSHQAYAQWYENYGSAGTNALFSSSSANAHSNALTIIYATTTTSLIQGDLNFDGNIDDSDTPAFVAATVSFDDWLAQYATPAGFPNLTNDDLVYIADFNYDGNVDDSDTPDFVAATVNGSFPPPPGSITVDGFSANIAVVPEPSCLGLVGAGMLGLISRRRRAN